MASIWMSWYVFIVVCLFIFLHFIFRVIFLFCFLVFCEICVSGCAQDTEQKHGKDGSGAPLSSFPLILAVVLAEHGGRLSSVDRDRELRIWNEREARRHECETRWTAYLERAWSSTERV